MFGHRIRLFSMLGFEVKIDLSWIIIAVLLTWSLAVGYFPYQYKQLSPQAYWLMGLVGALGLFLSIILHELSHSLVARQQGLVIRGITLFIFGGVAEISEEPANARTELLMAIAGPAMSVGLGVIFFLMYLFGAAIGLPLTVVGVLEYLGWINLLLAIFNLIPAFPLDGGRILRSFLWSRQKSMHKATRTAARIGGGFGVALILLGVLFFFAGNFIGGIWWFLIGLYLRNASSGSYQQLQIREALGGEPIQRFMRADPITVEASTSLAELVQDYIYTYHHRMFPVVEGSRVLGCIHARQLKEIPHDTWSERTVGELARQCSQENSVEPDRDAWAVLGLMRRTGNSRLLVMKEGRLMGIVTLKDLLRFLSIKLDLEGERLDASDLTA